MTLIYLPSKECKTHILTLKTDVSTLLVFKESKCNTLATSNKQENPSGLLCPLTSGQK